MDMTAWLVEGDRRNLLALVNEKLSTEGLSISAEDAHALADQRTELLDETERIEFCTPAVVALAETVATSPSLSQEHLGRDLAALQGVFYRLRDELPTDVPDSEIYDALRGCLDASGEAEAIAELEADEIMRHSIDYLRALDAEPVSGYRIADEHGHVYTFNEREWEYDEQADGWDGERWSDDWND